MICPKCGRNIPDGSTCPCSFGQPVLSSNPAVNTLKTLGSSPLFLVLCILFTLVPVMSILGAAMMGSNLYDMLYLFMQLDLDPGIYYPMLSAIDSISLPSAILGSIPSILVAVAVWMTYASCRNAQSGNVSTAGLTICKVLTIIQMVFVCLGAAALALGLVVLMIAGVSELSSYDAYYGDGMAQAGMAVVTVLFLIAAAVFALLIIYEICVVKTINRIKATATTGTPDNRIPNYLIVMNYIIAVGSVLAGLANLFTSPAMGLGSLITGATMVIISIILSKYRSGMTLLMYPPVQPAYPNQPTPPQGPWA